MADEDKAFSDPADQRTLADALSQTAGPYSPENLVSALRKKDQAPDHPQYVAGQGMPPWAADQPPEAPPDNRGYLERAYGGLQNVGQAGMNAVQAGWRGAQALGAANVHPVQTAKAAGQAALDVGRPAPPAAQPSPQQNLANAQRAPEPEPTTPGAAEAQPQSIPRPAPAQTIGEHWVNTMDPASRAAMATGQGQQLAGVGGEAEAESKAADEMARAAYHGHEDARVQQLLDRAQLDPERVKLDEHAAQLQAQAERLSQQKVDPEHYMASRSAGQKVMMALALAFSGFSAGLKGGPNQAMEFIKGAIDDDNRAQMQNIENARAGNEQQKGILADKMKLFGNKEQALAAARQEQLQGVAAQIDDIAKQYQSPEILAKAQQLKGELAQHFAAEGASVQKYVPAQTVGGAPSEASLDAKAFELVRNKIFPDVASAKAAVRQIYGQETPSNVSNYYEKPGTAKADPTAVANQGLANIDALRDAHGNLPTARLWTEQHGLGMVPVGTKARQLDGAITQLAEIQAKATGRATPQLIQQIKHTIIGNGSAVDVEAGIKRSRSLIQAGSATPLAGTPVQGAEALPTEAPL